MSAHEKTWRIDVDVMGTHSHIQVRHGVEGQRALLGTLVCDGDEMVELVDMFRAAGCVMERRGAAPPQLASARAGAK